MTNIRRKLEKNPTTHLLFCICAVVLSALMQVVIMEVFMNPVNLISGGFTGIALFLNKLFSKFGWKVSTSVLIVLLNIPAAAICFKAISRRFVMLSALQFGLVSVFLEIIHLPPLFYDVTCNILFGGILWGITISLALQAGGSTGGTDFIAQFVGLKFHRNIFDYVFYFNCLMYIAYGFVFGWIYSAYSIIFQFLSTQVINRTYKRYARVTMEITCKDPDKVVRAFMDCVHHGMSIIEVTGGYSGEKYFICKAVVAAYEVNEVLEAIRQADPKVLVNLYQSLRFYGSFYERPIE